jgi:hypothetical protein
MVSGLQSAIWAAIWHHKPCGIPILWISLYQQKILGFWSFQSAIGQLFGTTSLWHPHSVDPALKIMNRHRFFVLPGIYGIYL